MLLAGDIGGTKTNLAIFSPEAGPREPLAEATLPSTGYPSLEALVREFLSQVELADMKNASVRASADLDRASDIARASFGVAGPVVDGRAKITNLSWSIDERRLETALNLSTVRLLNDLEAIASAVPFVEADDLHTLNQGKPAPEGAIAIVAPGTGLGEAYLTWDGSRYRAHASEGGHTGFAPSNSLEIDMLRYLQDRFDHVSCERICSGLGLPNIYSFLKDSGYAEEPAWLAERLSRADDPTPVIVKAALADIADLDRASAGAERAPGSTSATPDEGKRCDLCVSTLDIFVSVLGSEAGDLALKVLATGGVYLGGGIPPRILPALEQKRFLDAFRRKGRFAHLMTDIPVHVILNPKIALLGAACYGLEL